MNTYIDYMQARYDASPMLQKYYSAKGYKDHYRETYGLSEYLGTIRNESLTELQTKSLAKELVRFNGRTVAELPAALASIAHQYNVTLPAVAGILTQPYWTKHLKLHIPTLITK